MQKQPLEVFYKNAAVKKVAMFMEKTSVGVPFLFTILQNL